MLVEMENAIANLEGRLTVSYEAKNRLTRRSSNHTPRYLSYTLESLCSHKNLHANAKRSFIPHFQKLEAMTLSFISEQVNRQ